MMIAAVLAASLQASTPSASPADLEKVCAAVVATRDDLMEQAIQIADARAKMEEAHRAFTYFGQAPDDADPQREIDRADLQARAATSQLEQAERLNRSGRGRLDDLINECFGLVLTPFSAR